MFLFSIFAERVVDGFHSAQLKILVRSQTRKIPLIPTAALGVASPSQVPAAILRRRQLHPTSRDRGVPTSRNRSLKVRRSQNRVAAAQTMTKVLRVAALLLRGRRNLNRYV